VLAVLYLLFNEGYAASAGSDLVRVALCDEAIRLGRCVVALMPEESEAAGLLALMLFQHSRRDARADDTGDLVTLEDQDRSRWDREEISEATAILTGALAQGRVGSYQVQATIAECHATAPIASSTDWPRVANLYGELARIAPSPVVELNRAVAVAMTEGSAAGLAILAVLEATNDLKDYYLLPATHADLLRRVGHLEEAAAQYRSALSLARTDAERRFLARRLDQVTNPRGDPG
jgi:RNA polymerase sigma-70 factor (ECF subfamily)